MLWSIVAYWPKYICILTISFTVVLAKHQFRQAWADLEKAGFTKKQAEESVRLLMEILKENLASKTDLKEVKTTLRTEIKEVKTELQNEIKEVKTELQNEIKELRN